MIWAASAAALRCAGDRVEDGAGVVMEDMGACVVAVVVVEVLLRSRSSAISRSKTRCPASSLIPGSDSSEEILPLFFGQKLAYEDSECPNFHFCGIFHGGAAEHAQKRDSRL